LFSLHVTTLIFGTHNKISAVNLVLFLGEGDDKNNVMKNH